MTDEQLVGLIEAGSNRLARRAKAEWSSAVEAVRVGYLAARDKKALAKWRRARDRSEGRSPALSGAALERAIGVLARTHPEYVVTR